MTNINEIIKKGAETAFIDENIESSSEYRPRLLVNSNGHKVLNSIKDELNNCEEFYISVAFITMGGLTPLLQDLKELERKGVKGKIITTDYLNFTEPKALRKLNDLSNIEIKMYGTDESDGFHTKGYIFKNNGVYRAIVGSSNLTLNALTINKEWNIGFSSLYDGEILKSLTDEFADLWEKSSIVEDIIEEYEDIYNYKKNFRDFNRDYQEVKEETEEELVPNSMQRDFLENLRNLIQNGEDRALLVSATGTGKTYAAAFAVKDFKPKKFLFLVHREQILRQAMDSFKRVFNEDDSKFGILSGTSKDYDVDYLFSTRQTMSQDSVYTKYDKEEFDYIVIDEVHKAGSFTYKKLLNYFTPKFWLGMTASPDRTDDENIYEIFNYNVPLDIRLQDALEEDLLCPFHYFGITDITVNGEVLDDKSDFNYLVSSDRVNYLLEKSEYYGFSGDRCKALVFCKGINEAEQLAKEFTRRGHPSISLTGDNSQEEREEAIRRLTDDEEKDYLEYIFTFDIFNEGVDIPEVNQVLLIRPTKSSIIFIQQLGRGLRKFKNKEYVVILDFIGNYENNFLIPIALSGDRTYDKDNIRRYLMEGSKIIPGQSSINFDEISKKRIYKAINNTNFSIIKLFKEAYITLKNKIGRTPYLVDFYENEEFNPEIILSHNKFKTYYNFLKYIDDTYDEELDDISLPSLIFLSKKIIKGIRPHEAVILKYLKFNKYFNIKAIEDILYEEYGLENQYESIKGAINLLSLNFFKKESSDGSIGQSTLFDHKSKTTVDDYQGNTVDNFIGDIENFDYENIFFNLDISLENLNDKEHKFYISDYFRKSLSSNVYSKHFEDLIEYSLLKYDSTYKIDSDGFKLYAKYSKEDVITILNWKSFMISLNIGGYRIKHNTCPIFVTYNKSEDISETIKYEDTFVSNDVLSWMSRDSRKLDSNELKPIINYIDLDIRLFVKKSDDEDGSEFYYMGRMHPLDGSKPEQRYRIINGNKKPIVNFKFKLENPIEENLYNYLMDKLEED